MVTSGLSSCSAPASHRSGFSYCIAWALGRRPSVVVAHGLSCSKGATKDVWDHLAPGIELALAGKILTTETPSFIYLFNSCRKVFIFASC